MASRATGWVRNSGCDTSAGAAKSQRLLATVSERSWSSAASRVPASTCGLSGGYLA